MNLIWYNFDRQELPITLLGEALPTKASTILPKMSNQIDVALGMNATSGSESPLPSIALLGSRPAELFSWISTYAEEIFPLTQFCRVCSFEDWNQLNLQETRQHMIGRVHPIWPSLVLGEMLGQADATGEVAGTPLARATACFSFPIARTAILYNGLEKAHFKCMDRLEKVGHEPRFAKRNISVDSLKNIWSTALILQNVQPGSTNLVDEIAQIVAEISPRAASLLTGNQLLMSDSAENRVIGFDEVVDSFVDMRNSGISGREGGAIALAAAALLVGRGTSHVQLLAPAAKLYPETLAWYGLLAGMIGPKVWDKAWMQQAKGVERALRQFFQPEEPVTADLCWAEYDWLSQTYSSAEALSNIPKSAPRNIAIELLPGVTCQFRLASELNTKLAEENAVPTETPSKTQSFVVEENAIARAAALLAQAQRLLQPHSYLTQKQEALFQNQQPQKQEKPKRKASKTTKTSS